MQHLLVVYLCKQIEIVIEKNLSPEGSKRNSLDVPQFKRVLCNAFSIRNPYDNQWGFEALRVSVDTDADMLLIPFQAIQQRATDQYRPACWLQWHVMNSRCSFRCLDCVRNASTGRHRGHVTAATVH